MRIVHDELLAQLLRSNGSVIKVFCEGILQRNVIMADEERGEVVRRAGDIGSAATETMRGRVQIEIVRKQQ